MAESPQEVCTYSVCHFFHYTREEREFVQSNLNRIIEQGLTNIVEGKEAQEENTQKIEKKGHKKRKKRKKSKKKDQTAATFEKQLATQMEGHPDNLQHADFDESLPTRQVVNYQDHSNAPVNNWNFTY